MLFLRSIFLTNRKCFLVKNLYSALKHLWLFLFQKILINKWKMFDYIKLTVVYSFYFNEIYITYLIHRIFLNGRTYLVEFRYFIDKTVVELLTLYFSKSKKSFFNQKNENFQRNSKAIRDFGHQLAATINSKISSQ